MIKNEHPPKAARNKKPRIKQLLLFTAIVMLVGMVNSSFCQTIEPLKLQLTLPKDISDTDFGKNEPFLGKLNGTPISFTGIPFLKDGTTYVPVRDIANSFGLGIEYDNNDRHIKLSSVDKSIVISPMNSLTVGGSVIIEADKKVQNEQKYMLINSRSYLPLRYILEAFSYSVDFDSVSKGITITGRPSVVGASETYVSPDQKTLIAVLANYEGAKSVAVSGKIKVLNTIETIEANITRNITLDEIQESTQIRSGTSQYRTDRTMGAWFSLAYSLKEINKDGTERQINLIGWGSNHPYFYLGDTGLSGIIKYTKLKIADIGMTDGTKVMKVTFPEDSTKTIEIGIEPSTNKMKTLKFKNQEVEKELNFAY